MRTAVLAPIWLCATLALGLASPGAAADAPLPACPGLAPEAGESYPAYRERARRAECLKPWTILVYMAADNDLAPHAYWDLHEMEAGYKSGRIAGGSTARADLLVQLTAPGLENARRIHVFQQKEPYDERITFEEFRKRGIKQVLSPVAARVPRREGRKPIPAAADFERFLEWGIREYPARHYMVVVWGHGQGWAPAKGGEPDSAAKPRQSAEFAARRFGGLAFSDSTGTFLDIPSLHGALRSVSERLLGGRPIDLYASDACLMQMAEVATEISDSARFVTGSSEVENYLGLPYRRMMYELNTSGFGGERARSGVAGTALAQDEPYLLARLLPRLFRASLNTGGLHSRPQPDAIRTVTMNALSSDELRGSLLPALRGLGRALKAYLAEDAMRSIGLSAAMRAAPSFMGGTQDLGGFVTVLRQSVAEEYAERGKPADRARFSAGARAVLAACDGVSAALGRTVMAYALGTRYASSEDREEQLFLLGIRALAIWLPASRRDYQERIRDFSSSIFYKTLGSDWAGWLKATFEE